MKNKFSYIIGLLLRILGITLLLGVVIILIGWIIGLKTSIEFSNAFFIPHLRDDEYPAACCAVLGGCAL